MGPLSVKENRAIQEQPGQRKNVLKKRIALNGKKYHAIGKRE